jgi:pilus assembly protein CpaB
MARQQSSGGAFRAVVFILIALFTGSLAILGLSQLVGSYQKQIDSARRPEDRVTVIVAARDLYQGVTITEEDLYLVEIPPKYLPEGIFLSPEYVVGRIPRERILANEFVRGDRLADPESGVGLNAVIPRGMRAVSIDVKDAEALSGFLNPLNYVDVLVTVDPPDKDIPAETRTLLQAVFVLGVNSRMAKETREEARDRRGAQKPSVTLLVTAEQAEQIAHANGVGEIRLSLRNDLDVNYATLEGGVDIEDLRRQLRRNQAPVSRRRGGGSTAAAPEKETIKIIKGDMDYEQEINADGTVDPTSIKKQQRRR